MYIDLLCTPLLMERINQWFLIIITLEAMASGLLIVHNLITWKLQTILKCTMRNSTKTNTTPTIAEATCLNWGSVQYLILNIGSIWLNLF